MKKVFTLVLCLVLCASMAGCLEDDGPVKEQPSTQTSGENAAVSETEAGIVTESQDETFGLNETAVFNSLKFTATEIKETEGTDFFKPEEGNVFVGVKFTIENISDEEQSVSTLLLFDGYCDDIKCSYSFNASCAFTDGTLDGEVAPGKKLVGWYALEVPADWSNIELNVQSSWLSNSSAKFVFEK